MLEAAVPVAQSRALPRGGLFRLACSFPRVSLVASLVILPQRPSPLGFSTCPASRPSSRSCRRCARRPCACSTRRLVRRRWSADRDGWRSASALPSGMAGGVLHAAWCCCPAAGNATTSCRESRAAATTRATSSPCARGPATRPRRPPRHQPGQASRTTVVRMG